MSAKGKKEIKLSIDETNKLREKLGLKPLKAEDDVQKPDDTVAKPTEQEIRDRVIENKGKRAHEKLVSGKGIADILTDEGAGGAADWARSQLGRSTAARQAPEAKRQKRSSYTEADLKGLKVAHERDDVVADGEVYVLQDQGLLDEDGNMRDSEAKLHNVRKTNEYQTAVDVETRKLTPGYHPDKDFGMLEQYEDPKREADGFTIGEPDAMANMMALNKEKEQVGLEEKIKFQTDFYTSDEMQKFRKPKKKVKKPKKGAIKKAIEDDEDKEPEVKMELDIPEELIRPADADSGEEDAELYNRLKKQKQVASMTKRKIGEEGLMERVVEKLGQGVEQGGDKEDVEMENLPSKERDEKTLTSTSQFCSVVQTPLEKIDTQKDEAYKGSTLYKQGIRARVKRGQLVEAHKRKEEKDDEEWKEILDDREFVYEEVLDGSAASALQYLRTRNTLGKDQDTHYAKEERFRPMEQALEADDIKIEYRDEFGRIQNMKEAYRQISWQFHGKPPSLKSRQKRMERFEKEMLMKEVSNLNAADLPTMKALKQVQKSDQKAYITLNGEQEG